MYVVKLIFHSRIFSLIATFGFWVALFSQSSRIESLELHFFSHFPHLLKLIFWIHHLLSISTIIAYPYITHAQTLNATWWLSTVLSAGCYHTDMFPAPVDLVKSISSWHLPLYRTLSLNCTFSRMQCSIIKRLILPAILICRNYTFWKDMKVVLGSQE